MATCLAERGCLSWPLEICCNLGIPRVAVEIGGFRSCIAGRESETLPSCVKCKPMLSVKQLCLIAAIDEFLDWDWLMVFWCL